MLCVSSVQQDSGVHTQEEAERQEEGLAFTTSSLMSTTLYRTLTLSLT